MEIVLLMIVVLFAGVVMIPVLMRRNVRETGSDDAQVTPRGSMPAPGAAPPRRHGEPMPGSGEDRARHGKP